ncbi:MAG TPA: protealysin inhibitor emfourin [Microbacterium sp.]|uniref:protealysin inhibitor emfourin n=1 Tax=Microbacterium sp. TaxID=51671 RepID=UPI002B45ECC9|nr:protealysin inhibitor emfourin [Microbacterium sp.]HKT55858.1 protealysin inhibitor emfourin [Microbacterium sp.]
MPDPGRVVVTVVRSGGIAGLRRRWEAEADADAAARWIELIDDCPWGEAPPPVTGADRFMWRISVQWDHADDRAVDLPDDAVTGPWQALVDAVRSAGLPPAAS